MPGKNQMPPQLLAHFKKKAASKNESEEATPEVKKENDKSKRKEALIKARTQLEEKNKAKRKEK